MSREDGEQGQGGEQDRFHGGAASGPTPRAPAEPPQGGLGILFLAAAFGLAVLLGGIGIVAYLVMSR